MPVQPSKSWKLWQATAKWTATKPKPPSVTATEIASTDHFRKACLAMGVEPTCRQAVKYLRGVGRWAPNKVIGRES